MVIFDHFEWELVWQDCANYGRSLLKHKAGKNIELSLEESLT